MTAIRLREMTWLYEVSGAPSISGFTPQEVTVAFRDGEFESAEVSSTQTPGDPHTATMTTLYLAGQEIPEWVREVVEAARDGEIQVGPWAGGGPESCLPSWRS